MNGNGRIKVNVKNKTGVIYSAQFAQFPVVFGRGPQCHISLPDHSHLSRAHGSISVDKKQVLVADLNSTNGIFVRGERRHEVRLLKSGSFEAGRLIFEVIFEDVVGDDEQTLAPAVVAAKASAPAIPVAPQAADEEDPFALTQVSRRLHKVSKSLQLESEQDINALQMQGIVLQGVVTWGQDILDVRQFMAGDEFIVGKTPFEPIYVPSLGHKLNLGKNVAGAGYFKIPKGLKWRLSGTDFDYSKEQAVEKRLAQDQGSSYAFQLRLKDVATFDLGEDVSLHMRYVEVPRPLVTKTWIENREVFKKAIQISVAIHLVVSLVVLFSAPKNEAPKVDNVPPRFAKLLVAPPVQILAAPPLPPKPEPPPPVEEPKPQPVVPEQKIVTKPKPKAPKKPVEKFVRTPAPQAPQKAVAKPAPAAPAPAKPTTTADSFADVFNSAAPAAAPSAPNLKINAPSAAGAPSLKTSGLVGALKSKVGQAAASSGEAPSLGQRAGQQGYAQAAGGMAGKRRVGGAVLGTPKFETPSAPQGLNNTEVMKIVNRHLNDIHRCYERALFQDSSLAGRVEYEWSISAAGVVTNVSVKRSELGQGEVLNNCVMGVFRKMRFPASKNGQSTVANIGFPFGKN